MNPRRKESKKWAPLPGELNEQIRSVFAENFAAAAQSGRFIVDGRIYAEELLLRVGYLENGRLRQANFDLSLDYKRDTENVMQLVLKAVDAAGSLMNDYFETEGEGDFPRSWKAFEVDGKTVHVQFTTENSDLEREADRLLGLAPEEALVSGDDGEDEVKAAITMLGLSDDDFSEDSSLKPKGPGGKKTTH